MKHIALLIAMSLVATLVSGCVPGEVFEVIVQSDDCSQGCHAAAAGWPVPYILDGRISSPVGSADLIGLLLGIDRLDVTRAVLNWAIWLLALSSAFWLARHLVLRARRHPKD